MLVAGFVLSIFDNHFVFGRPEFFPKLTTKFDLLKNQIVGETCKISAKQLDSVKAVTQHFGTKRPKKEESSG